MNTIKITCEVLDGHVVYNIGKFSFYTKKGLLSYLDKLLAKEKNES